ncbi:Camphor resistance CrcB protein [Xylanimonas cellulosilytica DSM 15894]|uniref:Fluoride-specific ion channel FluC n=1 Tax=Xylanimonas cellulosilytica (strain DSM 15894 / JCM 12276 / CECT 5975 / KCTC 9989 / LMG 20990 / NBRC 107835 / XIL07) TaxID=446471 RepID=D1BRL5_XYLCX|nr:CrcB family protein [Xylanimonas cellulosilytica]ACZ32281.1 Camphor resistance CrcB protein [Xylanimonas cellulosilytica DSM 15894]
MTSTSPHRDPRLLGLVALGGAVGSVLRYAVALALPPTTSGWPLGTLVVNVIGAGALGFLLAALARRGPETQRLQRLRLTLGTGLLGGFTTWSSFALETERLLHDGAALVAAGYVSASLVVGTLAAVVGILLGQRLPDSTEARRIHDSGEAAP